MGSVFMSHSWSDKTIARKLAKSLSQYGIDVWLDEAEIKLGDSLIAKIREGIDQVDYVIALISTHSVASPWVQEELEIAMNQQIEGKRVKVLPILVESCPLPGFLTGKLYADLRNARNLRQVLRMILDRMEVDPSKPQIRQADEAARDRKRAAELVKKLGSNNATEQYATLKTIKPYEDRLVLRMPEVIEAISMLTNPGNATHICLQALDVLGYLGDANYAYIVAPSLSSQDPLVIAQAILTLARLEATIFAPQLLKLFSTSRDENIQYACLQFFRQVLLSDEALKLSLLVELDKYSEREQTNTGSEIKIIEILSSQFEGFGDDAIIEALLNRWDSPDERVRLRVADAIIENIGDAFWIQDLRLRKRFLSRLQHIHTTGTDLELSKAWLIELLIDDLVEDEDALRGELWSHMLNADPMAVEGFFEDFHQYEFIAGAFFTRPEDLKALEKLLSSQQGNLKTRIADVLANIANQQALAILATHKVVPSTHAASDILLGFCTLEEWDDSLGDLLTLALEKRYKSAGENEALALICQLRAGRIDLDSAIDQFPTRFLGFNRKTEHLVIRSWIRDTEKIATRKQKQKLNSVLSGLDRVGD